ncbi:MAG: Gfo/Idh/MocA family oxidoreductase [Chloroflexota bacterium]
MIRWGILSTANIARSSFLPALRATGDGAAAAVAGRDPERTRCFAADNGVDRAVDGYDALLADPEIDAIYNPLPNSLHAEWTIKSLQAGKTVLCEKPLCITARETELVLQVARETGMLLWEAFVFPFREQTHRVLSLLRDGAIGELREIDSVFHFALRNRANIRLDPELGGGALYDVGCYPIRLARLLFDADADVAVALPRWSRERVDEELQGILGFPGERRLVFSCGMAWQGDPLTRLFGTEGEIRMTNPFHPNQEDRLTLVRDGKEEVIEPNGPEPSFTPAIQHIHAVLRGEEEPRHLAIEEALGNAQAIDMLYASARSGKAEHERAVV